MNNKEYACCFLDLLGFSSYTLNYDVQDSVRLIENYATIFQHRGIADDFKSFEYFHPASDSLFIISRDYDNFIKDLCEFCEQAYHIASQPYMMPANLDDVAEVTVPVIITSGVYKRKEHWFPTIFSGGVSFGEIAFFTQESYYAGKLMLVPNFVGEGITKSVHVGQGQHGSRIILDDNVVKKLSLSTKDKYVLTHDGINDLLWPAAYFIDANTVENNIVNGINEIFEAFLKFYNQYKNDEKLEAVYFNTLKIIAFSLIQYMNYRNATAEERKDTEILLNRCLKENKLQYLAKDLFDIKHWK